MYFFFCQIKKHLVLKRYFARTRGSLIKQQTKSTAKGNHSLGTEVQILIEALVGQIVSSCKSAQFH